MTSGLLVIVIAFLVLAQGGFFPLASCACGVIVCLAAGIAWLRKSRRTRRFPLVAMLFLGLALAFGASAFINGASLTTLSETGVWASCAGAAFLAASQDAPKRALWIRVLAWFGVGTAIAGVVLCTGLVPLVGGMVEERLQFTFQYANAAAAWYGVVALLCLFSPDDESGGFIRAGEDECAAAPMAGTDPTESAPAEPPGPNRRTFRSWQRAFAALPIAALFLTESGGALVVFAAVIIIVFLRWALSAQWLRLLQALAQVVLALALFLAVRVTLSPLALVALAAALVACLWVGKGAPGIGGRINDRTASLVLMGVFAIGVAAGLALLSGRAIDAFGSFGERIDHMRDGLSLWSTRPILGVGPDNWQYLYQYIQTAPYYSSVVHCSYVQLLVDAGIVGFGFFAAACVAGIRSLVLDGRNPISRGGWSHAELLAVVFLLAHALLDFDLQFTSLAFVLALLLSAPAGDMDGAGDKQAKRGAKGLIPGLACLLVGLPLCAIGLLCSSTSASMEFAETAGDYEACERMFQGSPLAQADVAAQSSYLAACYNAGDYDAVADTYGRMLAPTDRDVLYMAMVYYTRNEQDQATAVLAERLEEHPYDGEFLASAQQLVDAYGIGAPESARFNVAAGQVRSLTGEGEMGSNE